MFIVKTAKTVRNNWKKTVFATAVLSYGISYTNNYLQTQDLMRYYCQRAAKYGKQTLPVNINPRHITVILNPNANKRKASNEFEKYCAPLLHLAGISVDIKKTESEGHAKSIVDNIGGTDAIVIAGGDGTLSEVVTGLLRKTNEETNNLVPLGILPLGKNNSLAKVFFPTEKHLEKIRALAEATMAVIEESIKPADVMKIEIINENKEQVHKPVYAVASLKWGAYRDAEAKKDNYWVFGPFRKYVTYIVNGMKNNLSWNCEAVINYSVPCEGCSSCFKRTHKLQNGSWFQKFMKQDYTEAKYLAINNPECNVSHEKKISTADLYLLTSNIIPNISTNSAEIPKLVVEIGPNNVEYLDFVKNGFKVEKGERKEVKEVIEAKMLRIDPESNRETWFSIDNEYYEVKPIRITLLPKTIKLFCKKSDVVV